MNSAVNKYVELLKDYNAHTNIYSISAYEKLPFHILDSVRILDFIPVNTQQILDIGSGSGLPSIPMAITRPDIKITAVESKSRKTKFLIDAKAKLGLHNLTIITGDINEYIHQKNPKPQVITAKAFAPIERLLPLLKLLVYTKATVIIPISAVQKEALEQFKYPSFIKTATIQETPPHYYHVLTLH